jgi:uncharacterized membrane protein
VSGYEVALFLHLLGVMMLAGGSAAATVLGIAASRTNATRLIERYTHFSALSDRTMIVPGSVLLLAAGLWLVSETGYGYGDGWLIAAYVLFALALAIGMFALGPHGSRVNAQAKELVAAGTEESDELQRVAAAPTMALLGMLENVLIVVFLWLMIAKPGA